MGIQEYCNPLTQFGKHLVQIGPYLVHGPSKVPDFICLINIQLPG